jgi:hypothetical protein
MSGSITGSMVNMSGSIGIMNDNNNIRSSYNNNIYTNNNNNINR